MTLSTTSSSSRAAAEVNDLRAGFCAVVCAASAGTHGALVVAHARESSALAGAFLVVTVALGVAAVLPGLVGSPAVDVAVAVLLLGVASAYLLSRTVGLPLLITRPEPLDGLGVVISCLEVAAAWTAARPLFLRSSS